jgi:hypothetical protein
MRSLATILAGTDSAGACVALHVHSRSGHPQPEQTRPTAVENTSLAFTRWG